MRDGPAGWNGRDDEPDDHSHWVCMKILGDPNPVAHALGLDIDLPIPSTIDAEPWQGGEPRWKTPLRGRIADTCEADEDSEWALLLAPDWGQVWFDIEDGVTVTFPAAHIAQAVSLLARLQAHDVPLTFPGGMSRVWVMPMALIGDTLEIEARIEAAGFVLEEGRSVWTVAA